MKLLSKCFDFFIDLSVFCMGLILLIFGKDAYQIGIILGTIIMIVSIFMFFVDLKRLKNKTNPKYLIYNNK